MTPQDIAIIACQRRNTPTDNRRVIGVRWASRPDLGFPPRGYIVSRRDVPGAAGATIGIFTLPNTTNWSSFHADAVARRPLRGPYFPTIDADNLAYLLPLVRLADPRSPTVELEMLMKEASDFFGGIHADDAELAWNLWPSGTPPPLEQLLANPPSALLLIQFYRRHAWDYLQALAMRFEYAVLFGLGTDDAPPTQGQVIYQVDATWREERGVAQSDPQHTNSTCALSPPAWLTAERAPGTVAHPAFAAWPDWTAPSGFAPVDGDGKPVEADALVPRSPAAFTALTWTPAPPEPAVIGYGPILYRIARFDHGRDTAASTVEPPLPPNASFAELLKGEDLLRSTSEPNFLDMPGMAWPPLEGHYRYSLRAVNLLGVVSDADVRASLRHHDDIAPAIPRARSMSGPALELDADDAVTVPVRIDWDAAEDFASPDVAEFRLAVSWTSTIATSVHVTSVASVDALHIDITVASLTVTPNALSGSRLSMANGEFPIVSHGSGAPATMRVRRVAGRTPEAGAHGVVFAPGLPTPRTRVQRVPKRPAAPATVASVDSITPAEIALTMAAGIPLPSSEPVRIYLHLFRATFDGKPLGGARWSIRPPAPEHPAHNAWSMWESQADPRALLNASPAIVFPPHKVDLHVAAPTSFDAGLLEISCSAADATAYVSSPAMPAADPTLLGLRGNESAAARVPLSVRSPRPPDGPVIADWDPNQRLWASSAAIYKEGAEFTVVWSPIAGAVRYEVWRVLDEALPGAGAAANDHARRAIAEAHSQAFALRSGLVFSTTYRDELPGRAPTRAYYKVRAVGMNGLAGAMSGVIGPVYVPDVRQPPAPNLLRANALHPNERDRAVVVEWTQSGDHAGVRFDIQCRERRAIKTDFAPAGQTSAATEPPVPAMFRFVHDNRTPGKTYEYRIVAHREVVDPIDPSGTATRLIASAPSNIRSVTAVSSARLLSPDSVSATVDSATGSVTIEWSNRDVYEAITIRRRALDKPVYQLVAKIDGDAVSFTDTSATTGTWRYQVRAHGVSQEGRSDDAEAEVP